MHDNSPIKFTDFDYLTGDCHLQMLKAALPYDGMPWQRMLSILIKCQELKHTLALFDDADAASVGICSLDSSRSRSPLDMLEAIKPYGTPREQELIDTLSLLMQALQQPT